MRAHILAFAAGAAVAGHHAISGLALGPFFGASPFLWAHVVASMPLSIALGVLTGRAVGRHARAAVVSAAAGVLMAAVPIGIAPISRALLDRNPDFAGAAGLVVLGLVTIPSALVAAAIPVGEAKKRELGPGTGLVLLALGSVAGVIACAPSLLDPIDIPPWFPAWALAALVAGAASACAGTATAILSTSGVVAVASLFLFLPNEARGYEYRRALRQSWDLRVGRYYLETAGHRVLSGSEVARRYDDLRAAIARGRAKSIGAVLAVESLRRMGAVRITGEGLRSLLDLHLPPSSKAVILPLLDRVESVRSDGKGTIAFTLRWDDDEGRPIEVDVPDEKGGHTRFAFESDFTLTMHVEEGPDCSITAIAIGPLTIEKAGFLEANDTYRTPVVVRDVKAFIDARLLGFTVIERRDAVEVRVQAQGPIGGIEDSVLQVIEIPGA